jgi:hypothetical protein
LEIGRGKGKDEVGIKIGRKVKYWCGGGGAGDGGVSTVA